MRRFRAVPSCTKYRAFTGEMPAHASTEQHDQLRTHCASLGDHCERYLGILRVRGDWGFLDLPGPGFPELKVNFYKHTPQSAQSRILEYLQTALEQTERR